MAWKLTEKMNSKSGYETFISSFPNSPLANFAKLKMASLTPAPAPVAEKPKEPEYTVSPMDEELVAAKTVNVRSLPSVKGEKITRLSAGSTVSVTGKTSTNGADWYRVALAGGKTGFVFGTLLQEPGAIANKPASQTAPKIAMSSTPQPDRMSPGQTFKDCTDCPTMVVIPPGRFRMGDLYGGGYDYEKPVHNVEISYKFAVGKFEVTKGQYGAFVGDTGRSDGDGCYVYNGKWNKESSKSWRDTGFSQTDDHPVACINWDDAKAYVNWLSSKTGQTYRLLSESEWEYVARAGSTGKYFFGNSESDLCRYGNGAASETDFDWKNTACSDGFSRTSPVGRFQANNFGLYDTIGNVWEWTEDCWNDNYNGAPTTGDKNATRNCIGRVVRGGSWNSISKYFRSTYRNKSNTDRREYNIGFRIAKTL